MPLVVVGQVHHRDMKPKKVHDILRKRFPTLTVSPPEVSADLGNCSVTFFCNLTSVTDFTVIAKPSKKPMTATTATLARDAHNVNQVLLKALGRPFQRATLTPCSLEDEKTGGCLLNWVREESPLKSRPAILSYVLCFALLVIAAIFVHDLLRQPSSDTRNYNILSLVLAICLPAITLPLPFIYSQIESRKKGRWVFSQTEGGSL